MSKTQHEQFQALCKPLIEWLNENSNPHAKVIIETDGAELVTGVFGFQETSFIKD